MPRARAIPILAGALIAIAPAFCGGQVIETTPARPGAAKSGPPDASDAAGARRPEAARRIVRTFDFETHDPVVPELPALWFRAQHDPPDHVRPGFPLDNFARLDFQTPAAEGAGSVRLPTGGGSVGLRLDPAAAPALSGADYMIEAQVRTEGLRHARAFLAVRLLDEAGKPIEGAEVHSAPILAPEWTTVSVLLKGDQPEAAFLQVDLELRQPEQFQPPTLGAHQVWLEDFSGYASFDSVIISQFPRIEISTGAPANIILASETPTLDVLVRDLTGELLRTRIVVQDIAGVIVDQREQPLSAGRSSARWTPQLEDLGWYRATLEILNGDRIVGASYVDFIWIPDPSPYTASGARAGRSGAAVIPGDAPRSADRARFGLIATELPPEMRGQFAELARRAGVGAVSVPVWTESLTQKGMTGFLSAMSPLIDTLAIQWQEITLALARLPEEIAGAARLTPREPLQLFGRDSELWRSALLPLLERYGHVAAHWQVGAAGDRGLYFNADLSAELAAARDALGGILPQPSLVAPWPADQELAALTPGVSSLGGVVVSMPAHWPDQAMTELAADWAALEGEAPRSLTLAISSAGADDYGRAHAVGAAVRRMLAFWSAFGDMAPDDAAPGRPRPRAGAALVDPWTWVGERSGQVMPAPELAAWRCLIDRLSDRRIVGEYPLDDGVRCLILAPTASAGASRGGALALWRESGAGTGAGLSLYLGGGAPRMVDVFGNEQAIAPAVGGGEPPGTGGVPVAAAYQVAVGAMPVFIEGVDADLLSFLASLRLEPAFLETSEPEHEVALIATNPWPVGVAGRLFVRGPGGQRPDGTRDRSWRIAPRAAQFEIAAGAESRIPLAIAFSPGESSGPKALDLELDFTAEMRFSDIRLRVPFDIGLRDFTLALSWRLGSGGGDIVVEAEITSTTDRPLSLDVACFAPGAPRQSATVAGLPPGGAITRQFIFPGGAAALRGQEIVVTVTDMAGGGRLNGALDF